MDVGDNTNIGAKDNFKLYEAFYSLYVGRQHCLENGQQINTPADVGVVTNIIRLDKVSQKMKATLSGRSLPIPQIFTP